MKNLEDFRQEIDAVDTHIVELLGRRLDICRDVARYKKAHDIDMMQPGRVEEVKKKRSDLGAQHGIDKDFMYKIYTLIIEEACRIEDEIIAQ